MQNSDEASSRQTLMEQAVARDNMLAALRRVESNKGAAGVDGMKVNELRPYLKEHWPRIKTELLADTYKPQPVRRVEIPKPDGGMRLLGIPNALDRLIQQALLQILSPLFDPSFSEFSYGFRPGKRAHDAVRQAREYIDAGYKIVVDIDLSKFFDRVNHDKLMARVARKVRDHRVTHLIRRYLNAGVMIEGLAVVTEEGTPQGGPLSPLLGNIMLDDLDQLLAGRGHRFCRYADDCNIYVRNLRAGERVMRWVRRFIEGRLGLKINEDKSAVARPHSRKFLGFSFYSHTGVRIRLASKTLKRFKTRIREITAPKNGRSMERRIEHLNTYLRGWFGYFSLARTPTVYAALDGWIRRRLMLCQWQQWSRVRTRVRELRALNLPEFVVRGRASSRKGPWAMTHGPLNRVFPARYWRERGWVSLTERYNQLAHS